MFLTPCSAAKSASIIPITLVMQGGTKVPVNGPKGSRFNLTPWSS